MKNRLIYLLIISLSLTTMLVSCEEEGILPVNLPTAISFNLESDTVIVQPGGSTYDLELQSTTTSCPMGCKLAVSLAFASDSRFIYLWMLRRRQRF